MKILVAIIIPCLLLAQTCAFHDARNDSPGKKDEMVNQADKIDFEKEVLPVLVQNCSPCHFTGGKMYDKLPFDKAATLTDNADKILKRVEKDEKKAIIKEFILQNKSANLAEKTD